MEPIVIIYCFASDYCVRASSLDALERGYQVVMVKDLSRSVNPERTDHALEEMKQRGGCFGYIQIKNIDHFTYPPAQTMDRRNGLMFMLHLSAQGSRALFISSKTS